MKNSHFSCQMAINFHACLKHFYFFDNFKQDADLFFKIAQQSHINILLIFLIKEN